MPRSSLLISQTRAIIIPALTQSWPLGQTFPPLVPLAKTADYRGCNPKQGEVMPIKLKPCPFCGSDDAYYDIEKIFCDACRAVFEFEPDPNFEGTEEEEQIAAWNKRAGEGK